jgi:hypothetical protein
MPGHAYNPAMNMLKGATIIFLAAFTACLTGCVERKLTIGSDPSGAILYLNDQEIGRTPITVPFTWYGDYDIRLRLERNEGTAENPKIVRYYLHTHKETKIPAFEIVPMDFFAEVLPIPFKDEQVWAFPIPRVEEIPDKELLDKAEELKGQLTPVRPR